MHTRADTDRSLNTIEAECSRCSFANPGDLSFCGCCGAPLDVTCPSCGTVNPGRFRFCGGCGAPLPGESASPSRQRAVSTAERRQLTVMFCDLAGSTQLSLRLDPEELREVLRSYQAVCADAIERFDGHIAQYLGDGVLVYFGYPVALENEAERAVRAGLRVTREMGRLAARWRARTGVDLAVRIGIHTGLAVVDTVGGGAKREELALGGTPNIAARLQAIAQPNTVVISAATHRLISRSFECEDLGAPELHGVTGIGSVFRVDAARDTARRTPATPLIGRQAELTVLEDRWRQATSGHGQAVTVRGDPGIGKSHLIDEFLSRISDTTHVVIECRCLPYYRNTAFYPIVDFIERELGTNSAREPEQVRRALSAMLDRDGLPPEALPVLASLLGLPSDPDESESPGPEALRVQTRAWLMRLILHASRTCPVVFLIEDVHWADPSTIDLLEGLIEKLHEDRVLALFTSRPGPDPPWQENSHTGILELIRLSQPEAEEIVRAVAGKPLPAEVTDQIVARTDGVPLFIEELSRMVVQSGLLAEKPDRFELLGPLPPLAIPSTLKDSLEARLDRLAAVKEVAQLGAILGREFSYRLLAAAAGMDDAALRRALRQLVEAELIHEEGTAPDSTYAFRHALIQEAAYESLLRSTRQRHHHRIAAVLEQEFPSVAESEPETLAHHYTSADLPEQAARYWMQAARRALKASANVEAAAHLRRGIELLDRIPESADRRILELDMQAALGTALIAAEGYTSVAVREAYTRAHSICSELDDLDRLAPVVTGLFAHHLVRMEMDGASKRADELSALAERSGDSQFALLADAAHGCVRLTTGDLTRARLHLERAIREYDPDRHASLRLSFGHDIGVISHAYMGVLLWYEGYAIQSRSSGEAAVALARRINHPHSLALALGFLGGLLLLLCEYDEAGRIAEELLALATDWRFTHWEGEALLLQASVLAERDQPGAAAERLEHAIGLFPDREARADIRNDIRVPRILSKVGRQDEAIRAVKLALALAGHDDAFRCEADYYNLMAELLMSRPGSEDEAEQWLRRSLDSVRLRVAKFPELRAATQLATLLSRRGEVGQALELLVPVYESFTEGHELKDLRTAAEVVAGLRERARATGHGNS